ncbi:hypothetical protein V6N13_000537 [Hibiscus sabdariffa]|uniref:DUF632 domain-containing protein n=1 Tax=Hibiscus sabdariffa TaxID=183260 RepID=A0ABR2G5P7_9ROSI
MQLRNQDVKEDDPFAVGKTRAAQRDLHTQIKVLIHSVQVILKRIRTLRDEELQPQLLELVNQDVESDGYMWNSLANAQLPSCLKIQVSTGSGV